ncbi:MAG: alpha/beta fold hydrolase [Promethearchaeota archaeon]
MPYYKNKNNLNLYYEVYNRDRLEFNSNYRPLPGVYMPTNGHKITPPMIMIHGFGSSASFFQEQIREFKGDHTILVFDAEGHGRSEKKANMDIREHMIDSMTEDLLELLYLLNFDREYGIMGHSLVGGGIALHMALLFPSKIKYLILLNSGTMRIDNPIRNIFWNLLPQNVRMNFNNMIPEYLETILNKTIPYIRKSVEQNFNNNGLHLTQAEIDKIIETEILNMIMKPIDPEQITCPTLIIGSELDNYAPLWMSQELARKIKNSEYHVLSMAGHFGPSQRYQEYNRIIREFLNKYGF